MTKELKPFVSGSTFSRNGNYYILSVRCSEEEMEKTKRLIAAAPEMYEELYEVLQLLKGKTSWDGDEFAWYAKDVAELLARIDGVELNLSEFPISSFCKQNADVFQ